MEMKRELYCAKGEASGAGLKPSAYTGRDKTGGRGPLGLRVKKPRSSKLIR